MNSYKVRSSCFLVCLSVLLGSSWTAPAAAGDAADLRLAAGPISPTRALQPPAAPLSAAPTSQTPSVQPMPVDVGNRAVPTVVPVGARIVTETEWANLTSKPGFYVIDQQSRNAQQLAASNQLAGDEAEIRKAERAKGLKLMPPEVTPNENTRALADGNWLHTVTIKGEKRQFTTMGSRWSKHAVATALRTVGTRTNQIQLYESIYRGLDQKMIDQLALVDPRLIRKYPDKYSDTDIAGLNRKLAKNARELVNRYNSPLTRFFASKCAGDVGQGVKGDEFGNSPYCQFSRNGIYSNFAFPMQPDMTCVKDQNLRGSCAAFAVTADIEYKVHKNTGQFVNLSEQALYNQAKFNWFRDDFQEGVWPNDVLNQMEGTRWPMPFENQWDYNPSHSRVATMVAAGSTQVASYSNSCNSYTETCSDSTHQGQMSCVLRAGLPTCGFSSPTINPGSLGYRVTGHGAAWDPADVDTSMSLMMLSLVFRNPIILSFHLTDGWGTVDDAGYLIYYKGQPSRGSHAALIVGYITNGTLARILPGAPLAGTEGYFIVKNSWSNCFGDGGYAYVPYDYVKVYTLDGTVMYGVQ